MSPQSQYGAWLLSLVLSLPGDMMSQGGSGEAGATKRTAEEFERRKTDSLIVILQCLSVWGLLQKSAPTHFWSLSIINSVKHYVSSKRGKDTSFTKWFTVSATVNRTRIEEWTDATRKRGQMKWRQEGGCNKASINQRAFLPASLMWQIK